MSLVQNLIKKAFLTTNANEAASFLASACNRMKLQNKEQIMREVSTALVNVNLTRFSDRSPPATRYQDSPDTLQRLWAAEARAASLLSQLREEQQKNSPQQTEPCEPQETSDRLRKFETQVVELKKALNISQEMHLKESALVRSVMQREIDTLKSHFTRYKTAAGAKTDAHHREKEEYHQRLTAADALIKTQHEARLRAESEVAMLYEKFKQLQSDNLSDFEQSTDLHTRLAKTIDELSATRNMLMSRIEQWSLGLEEQWCKKPR